MIDAFGVLKKDIECKAFGSLTRVGNYFSLLFNSKLAKKKKATCLEGIAYHQARWWSYASLSQNLKKILLAIRPPSVPI